MAQLTNTLINGDLRVTGNIYGNDVANRVSASYSTAAETGGRWAKLASAAVPTGTYCNVNGDWIVRVVGETFSLDMPFTLNVRTFATNDAPSANAFIKINTESSYGYKNGSFGVCVVTYGNTPNVTVEVWAHTGYNYSTISLIELASGNRDISPQSKWAYTDASGAGSSKPTASGTTRVTDATTVLIGCCADNAYGAGNSTTPVYVSNLGVLTACSTYAGGTAVTLNGTSKSATTASFYAPTGAGTSGQVLKSSGSGAPSWGSLTASDVGAKVFNYAKVYAVTEYNASSNRYFLIAECNQTFTGNWQDTSTFKLTIYPGSSPKYLVFRMNFTGTNSSLDTKKVTDLYGTISSANSPVLVRYEYSTASSSLNLKIYIYIDRNKFQTRWTCFYLEPMSFGKGDRSADISNGLTYWSYKTAETYVTTLSGSAEAAHETETTVCTVEQANKLTDRTNSGRYVQVAYYGSGTITGSNNLTHLAGFFKPDGDSSSVMCDVTPAKLAAYLSGSDVNVALQNGTYTSMTVGKANKVGNYSIVVGALGTDTSTLYFV